MKSKAPDGKDIFLCSDCRELFSVAFTVTPLDGAQKASTQKCENCGGAFFVLPCRVKKKKRMPTG